MKDLGTARPHIASYVILRRDNTVAFLLRENTDWMSGYYGLPAGKVENNESFIDCAVREAKEEIGVIVGPTDLHLALTMHRKDDEMYWVDIFFEAASWHGEPFSAEPEIHSELSWLDLNKLPENIVPNVRYAMEQIQADNTYCEFGWN